MARIMSEESSLTRKRQALARETRALHWALRIEAALALVLLVAGAVWYWFVGGVTLFALGAAAALFSGAHWLRARQNRREDRIVEAGLRGETEVMQRLQAALDQSHYVFNDLRIKVGRAGAQIDHLVVCPRGLFMIETKNWRGRIVGDVNCDQWQQFRAPGQPPIRMHNPVRQVKRQAEMLRSALDQQGLGPAPIHPYVVFLSPSTAVEVPDSDVPLLHPGPCVEAIAQQSDGPILDPEQVDALVAWLVKVTEGTR